MRLIDANWVKEKLKKALDVIAVQMSDSIMSGDEENFKAGQNQHSAYATALTILNHAPTIEAVPVVEAEWKWIQQPTGESFLYCSKCKELALCDKDGFQYESEICPSCGAMMKGSAQNSYRDKIIDEFAQKAIERLEDMGCEAWRKDILAIAKEMKGGVE